ncbi:MAG: phosphatidylglycerol lysyltransferase domain-containing protein [Saprospiraceae bacterium]
MMFEKYWSDLFLKTRSFLQKAPWRELIALLMLLLGIVFFRSERKELHAIIPQIQQAHTGWLALGVLFTFLYVLFQSGIYKLSFSSIGCSITWVNAISLYIKRNLISIFLPVGNISALAYTPDQIRKAGIHQTQINQASGLFSFIGLFTTLLIGVPISIFAIAGKYESKTIMWSLAVVIIIIIAIVYSFYSIRKKGKVFQLIERVFPSDTPYLNELFSVYIEHKKIYQATIYSLLVEITGVIHIYIAMLALGVHASIITAAVVYITAVLMMIVSPFLKGLGVVELSMVYVLEKYGYDSTQALSITIIYRIFEFWQPMLLGIFAFSWKGRKLFLRIIPVFLSFILGIVNIISVVTPPQHDRLTVLREYLPLSTIHASNLLVLFVGLGLLLTSAFLIRGLRNAWIITLGLALFSFIGHLTKALDYEEAIIAAIVIIILLLTSHQYRLRSSLQWMKAGIGLAVINFIVVMLFGFISFYFIDVNHFGVDFSWQQSFYHSFRSFLLVDDSTLHPVTKFGIEFIWLVRSLGFLTWAFLLFSLVTPRFSQYLVKENYFEKANYLLSKFGNSPVDYFKTYRDKLIFYSNNKNAFVSYRIAGGYAIVLEEPVCAPESKVEVVQEFDLHCRKMGLKSAFYRVGEKSIAWFDQLGKKKLIIGQEAIVEVNAFSLEGKERKSLRNGYNGLERKGFTTITYQAPHSDELVHSLKLVSDEWLNNYNKKEQVFSQGIFDEDEIQKLDIITLQDGENKIVAFLNIIPDYAASEITYDLIRKTIDAPGAAMDALIIRLIEYGKEHKKKYLNLGLVPMTGILQPDSTAEHIIKIASENFNRFQHFQGLREFKEKYANYWQNKYLVYDDDFDLLQLPLALNSIMKP